MYQEITLSKDLIKLFQRQRYEEYVCELMNLSKSVFPGTYIHIEKQSKGECDFVDNVTGKKYDAKIPFKEEQIGLITSGKKHEPLFAEWIKLLINEQCEYDIFAIRNGTFNIKDKEMYKIMSTMVEESAEDESIIFFIPFPFGTNDPKSVFDQFVTDYLKTIHDEISRELELKNRSIFAIYPSTRKNVFVLRDLSRYGSEFIAYDKLEPYFFSGVVNGNRLKKAD